MRHRTDPRPPDPPRTGHSWARRLAALLTLTLTASLGVAGPALAADVFQYRFEFVNGAVVEGSSPDNEAFLADAGGTDANNPTGMVVHVSCSDEFTGGFGEKDGPDRVADSAWQIATWSIQKFKDGTLDKSCGGSPVPPPPPPPPAIDLVKTVNGEDANVPTGPRVQVGDTVVLAYRVTNTGGQVLTGIAVTDADLGPIPCPSDTLAPGASMDCDEQRVEVTSAGQQFMEAAVVGFGTRTAMVDPAAIAAAPDDEKVFEFVFVNGTVVRGSSPDNTAFLPGAGGTNADAPIGMEVHVSCSDDFPNGFGEKDGPDPVRDSAWQIASYEIVKVKDGAVDNRCGEVFRSAPVEVSDDDPVHYIADDVPPPPVLPPPDECTLQPADGKLVVEWTPVAGASRYAVWRNGRFLASIRTTRFVDPTPPADATYQVLAATPDNERSEFVTCKRPPTPPPPPPTLPPPSRCEIMLMDGHLVVDWSAVEGAFRYAVWRNGRFLASVRDTAFVDPEPVDGGTYQVLAATRDNVRSEFVDCGGLLPPPPPPPGLPPPDRCSVRITDGKAVVEWSAVDGASRYAVWRDGSFLASVGTTSYVDPAPGIDSAYTVRAATKDNVRSAFVDCPRTQS